MRTLFRRYCYPLWLRLQIARGLVGRPWMVFVWLFQQLLKLPWEIVLAIDVLGAMWLSQVYQGELLSWQPPQLAPANPPPLNPPVIPDAPHRTGNFMGSLIGCLTIGAAIGWIMLLVPLLFKRTRLVKWLVGLGVFLLVASLFIPTLWGAVRGGFYVIGLAGWLIRIFQLGNKVPSPGSRPHAD